MTDSSKAVRVPAAYIPHGGGPLPILGDPEHVSMVKWLGTFASTYLKDGRTPKACLVISAHWEEALPTVQTGEAPSLYYDYYGFPKESYNLRYPIKPDQGLVQRVQELLSGAGIKYSVNAERGYDHGVFIPMMLIYPNANIPTIQLSLVKGLDPEVHIKMGEALAPLREEGVFILGSGMSYHNMRGFRDSKADQDSIPFHAYLRETLADNNKSYEEKKKGLVQWTQAPKARLNHPREEHLIPIMTILGSSKSTGGEAKEVFFDNVSGVKCAGYVFD